jgi:O-antigen/teichoic acid export membrane protein
MSNIRRQSIISSVVIYIGFAAGLLNTYFFTRQGNFSAAQYGLTTVFIAIATMMSAFAMVGMPSFIYKFYHYYNDNVPPKKNDMITWALLTSLVGFALVMVAGFVFKDIVIKKYGTNAPLLVKYYYWIFPFGLGLTIYNVLEAYTWTKGKPVLANFFREVEWRLLTSVLLVLTLLNVIKDFDLFIKLYAFTYPGIAISLFAYLVFTKKIHFTIVPSKITTRLLKKMAVYTSFVFGSSIIFNLSQVFDSFVITSVLGLEMAGVFGLATVITSIIQAPHRAIISASLTHLSKAWKDKNIPLLQRIYKRSSINLLVFSCAIFLLIWMNFYDAVDTFKLKPEYNTAAWVFFILGITKIIDMGTGVNSQIIITSNFWRFELLSGIVLILFMLPLTVLLTKSIGLRGTAIATLISVTVYNTIRIIFLWKKYRLFPFSIQAVYTLLLAAACYAVCYFAFKNIHGLPGMFLRSILFIALYAAGAVYMKLSPDIEPVVVAVKKRLGIKKNQ